MESQEQKDKKNRRVGWLVSGSVQLLLLILFYFLIAWKAPFPPIPEYGIELGFTSSAGSTQSAPNPTVQEPTEEDEVLDDNSSESQPEETPIENEQSDLKTETAVVDESEAPLESEETTSSPTEETEKVEEVQTENNVVADPIVDPVETQEETEVQEEVVEEPTIDDRAIYGSQGTETGTAEGASLALAGWIWDFKPIPDDKSDETGKIVYKIVVDQEGYLVKIEPVTSTLSPAVERKYREAVQKLTFSKTSDYRPAALSEGTLTFIIKAR